METNQITKYFVTKYFISIFSQDFSTTNEEHRELVFDSKQEAEDFLRNDLFDSLKEGDGKYFYNEDDRRIMSGIGDQLYIVDLDTNTVHPVCDSRYEKSRYSNGIRFEYFGDDICVLGAELEISKEEYEEENPGGSNENYFTITK